VRLWTYEQHFISSFNFLLTSEKDKNVTEWLRHVNLQHRHDNRIDVVRLWSFCVVDVHRIPTTGDTENWCIIEKLNTITKTDDNAGKNSSTAVYIQGAAVCTQGVAVCIQGASVLEVGRVPGDYLVPAGYCTTRHYPDPTGYYFKMWPDPGTCHEFCDSQLYVTYWNAKREFVLQPSLIYDTVTSRVTDNCPLVASRGRGDGNLPRDGLISQLTRHYSNVHINKWSDCATRFATTLFLLQRLLSFGLCLYVYTTGSHYPVIVACWFHCKVIVHL